MSDQVKINFIANTPPHNDDSVNFTKPEATKIRKPSRGRKIKKLLASLVIVAVIAFTVFASSVAFSNENLIKNLSSLNFLGQVSGLIVSGDRSLQGEANDRINFALIGIGGQDHEGGTLADTIIMGSLKPSTNQIAMMSIPRDLYVKAQNLGWVKINAINAYAERKEPNSGGEATRTFLSDLLKTDIQYYAVIDFDGFEKLIDEFGGIDVYVDNDLIDNAYPIRGREDAYPIESRFERLVIKTGWHHFDGATALKYARSRHGLGGEGSDFARSKRQQKILLALKDKILKYNFALNPTKISSLLDSYNKNVHTNLQLWEMLKLLKFADKVDYEHPITYSLVDGKNPLLYDQMANGAYVLLPYGGNYDKISYVFDNIFTMGTSTIAIDQTKWAEFKNISTTPATSTSKSTTTSTATTTPTSVNNQINTTTEVPSLEPSADKELTYQNEKASIQVLNGTVIEGWASKEAAALRAKGFTVSGAGNSASKGYTSVKIYDYSGGKNQLTISELQAIYGVKVSTPPTGLKSTSDILIILGK